MNKPQEVTSFCPPFISSPRMLLVVVVVPRQIITWERPTHLFVDYSNDYIGSFCRLLDICHGQRHQREMSLYLVFEHVHQDLATYLENCPSPGLGQDRIKVRTAFLILRPCTFNVSPWVGALSTPKQMCSLIPFKC